MNWNVPSSIGWLTSLLCLAACTSPGPTPPEFAEQEPPRSDLDAATRQRIEREIESAFRSLSDGEFDAARRIAEGVLRVDARAGRARAILGRTLVEEASKAEPPALAVMERAEGEILLARRLDPDDAQVGLLHAEFLEADGQVTFAASVLDEVLTKHPDNLAALRRVARLRFELGQERVAGPLLVRVLAATPDDASAMFRLAHCRVRFAEAARRADADESREVESAAKGKSPTDVARDAFVLAADTFRDYRSLKPLDIGGFLGEVHARYGAARLLPVADVASTRSEIVGVLSILAEAKSVDPDSPAVEHSRGVILEDAGRQDEAREAYRTALRHDPKYAPSVLNLIHLLDVTGDRESARVYCRRALELKLSGAERQRVVRYLRDTESKRER